MMQIQTGQADIVVACGTENMTQLPFYVRKGRYGYNMGHGTLEDGLISILTWPEGPYHNGMTAENVAERFDISREEMDDFAVSSQLKAAQAIESGLFKDEIIPVEIKTGRKETRLFETDEHPRAVDREKLASLRPVFKEGGSVTAANASGINDGAAAVVLMKRAKALELGLTPRLTIRGWSVAGCEAEIMGFGPAPATKKLLKKFNLEANQVDLYEINEAFAAQALAVMKDLQLDEQRVNVNGGAIALGHPVGATGTILTVKLMYEMERRNANTGIITMCIGGGQGISMLFERE
jgi:acetyl-CoA C-acetyltransferase